MIPFLEKFQSFSGISVRFESLNGSKHSLVRKRNFALRFYVETVLFSQLERSLNEKVSRSALTVRQNIDYSTRSKGRYMFWMLQC